MSRETLSETSINTKSYNSRVSFLLLPYDLKFSIVQDLTMPDLENLSLTCHDLRQFVSTLPKYSDLPKSLLQRCRPLPVPGFSTISCLSVRELVTASHRAKKLEMSWLTGTPTPSSSRREGQSVSELGPYSWYRILSTTYSEAIDWLTPITSDLILCATKRGQIACHDIKNDVCVAEWKPDGIWDIWRCRTYFNSRVVHIILDRRADRMNDQNVIDFALMKLEFPPSPFESSYKSYQATPSPRFSKITTVRTCGHVLNIYLPGLLSRLLLVLIWLSASNTFGLYGLLDWDIAEYIFIDTDIEIPLSANWSCTLNGNEIVIHVESSQAAYQYFYPMSVLRDHVQLYPASQLEDEVSTFIPQVSVKLAPTSTISSNFLFPVLSTDGSERRNPFPFPHWHLDRSNFVRQWWCDIPSVVSHINCSVVLSSDNSPDRTRYVLSQHYYNTPLYDHHGKHANDDTIGGEKGWMLRKWYISKPFEVASAISATPDANGTFETHSLLEVDFGHAVWIENEYEKGVGTAREGSPIRRLKFVSFPPIVQPGDDVASINEEIREKAKETEGTVRTLEVPEELDLNAVETLHLDQSEGSILISVGAGRIFVLYYE